MSDDSLSSFSSAELETDKASTPALQVISEGEEGDTDLEDVPQMLPTFSGESSDKSVSELLLAPKLNIRIIFIHFWKTLHVLF